jgi:hypothetical protein
MNPREASSRPVTLDNRPFKAIRKSHETIQVKVAERPNLGRHAAKCRICSHPQREEMEQAFVNWWSSGKIAQEFGLRDRSSVHRHAHALGLSRKRWPNLRVALEPIIEQAGDVKASASAIVNAIQLCARINSRGELIEPDEQLGRRDLFDRMNRDELKAYAENATLPSWFRDEIVAAGGRVPVGGDDE